MVYKAAREALARNSLASLCANTINWNVTAEERRQHEKEVREIGQDPNPWL